MCSKSNSLIVFGSVKKYLEIELFSNFGLINDYENIHLHVQNMSSKHIC